MLNLLKATYIGYFSKIVILRCMLIDLNVGYTYYTSYSRIIETIDSLFDEIRNCIINYINILLNKVIS